MKIASKFRVTSSPKTGDGQELGIFADLLDDNDCPAFSSSNLERDPNVVGDKEGKQVAVFVYQDGAPDDQAPEMFICSKRLSRFVRRTLSKGYDRDDVLALLLTLKVFENDKGRFIAVQSVKRDNLNKKALLDRVKKLSYDEFAAVTGK